MKINVTAEDIARGTPGSCSGCPITLAIRRAIPDSDPRVHMGLISLCKDGVPLRTPLKAKTFIHGFDAGLPSDPFEFELPV